MAIASQYLLYSVSLYCGILKIKGEKQPQATTKYLSFLGADFQVIMDVHKKLEEGSLVLYIANYWCSQGKGMYLVPIMIFQHIFLLFPAFSKF